MRNLIFLINLVFSIYYLVIFIRAALSWFPHDRYNPIISIIYSLTEPILSPIRLGLPPAKLGFDVSPFIALVFLWLIQKVILWLVFGLI